MSTEEEKVFTHFIMINLGIYIHDPEYRFYDFYEHYTYDDGKKGRRYNLYYESNKIFKDMLVLYPLDFWKKHFNPVHYENRYFED